MANARSHGDEVAVFFILNQFIALPNIERNHKFIMNLIYI